MGNAFSDLLSRELPSHCSRLSVSPPKLTRMPIEVESPEEYGLSNCRKFPISSFSTTNTVVAGRLRELIVGDSGLEKDDALITSGAAGALFIISTSQLSKDDRLLVMRPNYATSLEPPKANSKLQETFLAAKEQISICGSILGEWVAEQVLDRRHEILRSIKAEMRKRLSIVEAWIETEDLLGWLRPEGRAVCFPHMKNKPVGGTNGFYQRLLLEHGTYVGLGHWFEMSDTCFRLGFGSPSQEQFENGLVTISKALRG